MQDPVKKKKLTLKGLGVLLKWLTAQQAKTPVLPNF
jgi:hypothetical protein